MGINYRSFNSGELGPQLQARADLEKYYSSVKRSENAFVEKFGGVIGRNGTTVIREMDADSEQLVLYKNEIYTYSRDGTTATLSTSLRSSSGIEIEGVTSDKVSFFEVPDGLLFFSNLPVQFLSPGEGLSLKLSEYIRGRDTFRTDVRDPVFSTATLSAEKGTITGQGDFLHLYVSTILVDDREILIPVSAFDFRSDRTTTREIPPADIEGRIVDYIIDAGITLQTDMTKRTNNERLGLRDSFDADNILKIQINLEKMFPASLLHVPNGRLQGFNLYKGVVGNKFQLMATISEFSVDDITSVSFFDSGQDTDPAINPPSLNLEFDQEIPQSADFFGQRLIMGASPGSRRIWASALGDHLRLGTPRTQTETSAFNFTLAGPLSSQVNFLRSSRGLVVGTQRGEFLLGALGIISPTQINAYEATHKGSAAIRPEQFDESLIFVQKNRKTVIKTVYTENRGGQEVSDLTKFSPYRFANGKGIKKIAAQKGINDYLWVLQDDGALSAITISEEDKVMGWSSHFISDGYSREGGEESFDRAEVLDILRDSTRDDDRIYLLVRRGERKFLEVVSETSAYAMDGQIAVIIEEDGQINRGSLDLLAHHAGKKLAAIDSQGFVHASIADENLIQVHEDGDAFVGRTLEPGGYVMGVPFIPTAETIEIETPRQDDSVYQEKLNVKRVILKTLNTPVYWVTSGGKVVKEEFRDTREDWNLPVQGRDDPDTIILSGSYGRGSIKIEQRRPLNFNILSIFLNGVGGNIEERGKN